MPGACPFSMHIEMCRSITSDRQACQQPLSFDVVACRVARDIVNLQGAELVRLHEELDKAKAENERLKGRLEAVQNEEFGQLRLSALGLVEMAGNFQATREQLQAAKLESEGLHAQIAELRNELNTALTNKDEASKELSIVLQQQTVSEQQMRALESSSSDKCAQLLSQLQEAYQDRACLEARLEDSEQSMHATMELLNGTESELAETRSTKDLLNETVASLLAELSEQQATSERLKNLHATAAAQQVTLDMLHAAQKDFQETLSKKVSALASELNLACTQAMTYQSELEAAKERERVLRLALETSAIGVMETEIQSSRNVTLAADPYHDMPAGKTVDEVFTPFSRKTLPFENIAKVCRSH
ncbi:hypothetical protein AcW2_006909 [Taiwanofungus camphoratus]|nr:hypothetical protein AcW2_006909 [Antrodia cinnamomea]